MEEEKYWSRLEYRLCKEFRGMTEGHLHDYWCDGIYGEVYFVAEDRPRILGHAWICNRTQYSEWKFELLLPQSVQSREHIDWERIFPADDVTRWLAVDKGRKFIQIEPGAAVSDIE